MIATRLSSVWQVAGVAGAALCCYLVSQSVAAERAGLASVDAEIARTHDQIAMLQTEIGTRTQAQQVERWNNEHFALHAPKPEQFVSDAVQLVSLYARGASGPQLPLDPAVTALQGPTEKVAYHPAPAPQAAAPAPVAPAPQPESAPALPLLRTATFVRAKPDRLTPDAAPVERAAYHPAATIERTAFHPAAPVEHAAYHPAAHSLSSLLPPDIAEKAAAEQADSKAARARSQR